MKTMKTITIGEAGIMNQLAEIFLVGNQQPTNHGNKVQTQILKIQEVYKINMSVFDGAMNPANSIKKCTRNGKGI